MSKIVTIDIETIPGGEKLTKETIPRPKSMKIEKTINKWREESAEQAIEDEYRKRALIPHRCRVVSWAVKTDVCESSVFMGNESGLIKALNEWLKENTNSPYEVTWSGVNIRNFDLIILKQRAWKYEQEYLRQALTVDIHKRIFDIMDEFTGSKYRDYLVSKDDMCNFFGIPVEGDSGSQVYDWYVNHDYGKIKDHCLNDVRKEHELLKYIKH